MEIMPVTMTMTRFIRLVETAAIKTYQDSEITRICMDDEYIEGEAWKTSVFGTVIAMYTDTFTCGTGGRSEPELRGNGRWCFSGIIVRDEDTGKMIDDDTLGEYMPDHCRQFDLRMLRESL